MAEAAMRIGVIGLTHDHVWRNLEELNKLSEASLVAGAERIGPLREKLGPLFGCPVYEHGREMLEQERLEAVYIFSNNAASAELGAIAAARGLHVMLEKPLAADRAGADKLLAAVRQHNVRLMVNWPFAWWPALRHALDMAAAGELGEVWQVKYRAAHAGPKELGCSEYFCEWLNDPALNGGGAMMDYCCYGAALACHLLGLPSRVTAAGGRLLKDAAAVEDNGVLLMGYPRALAISEGSWTQVGHMTSYVTAIYGTRATLLIEPGVNGRLLKATVEDDAGSPIDVPPLAEHNRSASAHFVHCLRTGEAFYPLCNDRVGRDTQEVLAAGFEAARTGNAVPLPLAPSTW